MPQENEDNTQIIESSEKSPFGPGWRKVSSKEKGFWGVGGQFDTLAMEGKIRYHGKEIWIKYD